MGYVPPDPPALPPRTICEKIEELLGMKTPSEYGVDIARIAYELGGGSIVEMTNGAMVLNVPAHHSLPICVGDSICVTSGGHLSKGIRGVRIGYATGAREIMLDGEGKAIAAAILDHWAHAVPHSP